MDTTGLSKTAIRNGGGATWRKKAQNWTKVRSLMPPPAAVKLSHSPSAKWTPRPYCSHSAYILHPPLSSSHSLSSFPPSPLSQKIGTENPFCPTNQIILYCHFPSPLCLPFPLPPSHSIIHPSLPPFPSSSCLSPTLSLSLPSPLRKGHLMWWKM